MESALATNITEEQIYKECLRLRMEQLIAQDNLTYRDLEELAGIKLENLEFKIDTIEKNLQKGFKKLYLEILEQNPEKNNPNLKEISNSRLSSYISKKEIECQRLLELSRVLEKKYDEYIKSKKLKTYKLRDIIASVNSMLVKDNSKPVTKRTIQRDLQKLIKMNLVANFSKSLGKWGFSLYKVNTNIWHNRIAIIRDFFENEIREYTKDKVIVTINKKEIDEYTFPNSNSTNSPMVALHKAKV